MVVNSKVYVIMSMYLYMRAQRSGVSLGKVEEVGGLEGRKEEFHFHGEYFGGYEAINIKLAHPTQR